MHDYDYFVDVIWPVVAERLGVEITDDSLDEEWELWKSQGPDAKDYCVDN